VNDGSFLNSRALADNNGSVVPAEYGSMTYITIVSNLHIAYDKGRFAYVGPVSGFRVSSVKFVQQLGTLPDRSLNKRGLNLRRIGPCYSFFAVNDKEGCAVYAILPAALCGG
jgi:hypothetical protein